MENSPLYEKNNHSFWLRGVQFCHDFSLPAG
jgi:hypothetical protein